MDLMMQSKTKFIIFGQGRTGSSLLLSLMNSHPDVKCEEEIFHKNKLRKKYGFIGNVISRYPIEFIYYRSLKNKNRVFGFKLFYQHLNNTEAVLTKLNQKGWKIIHLQRENILKQSISWMIANQTNSWGREAGKPYNGKTYHLDPNKLHRHTKRRIHIREMENQLMDKLDHLDVIYEFDLYDSDKWPGTSRRVFDYLGVYPVEVQTIRMKTDHRPDSERIVNFKEVMDYMNNNGFEDLVARYHELSSYY